MNIIQIRGILLKEWKGGRDDWRKPLASCKCLNWNLQLNVRNQPCTAIKIGLSMGRYIRISKNIFPQFRY
jgi:hypothetical protein